MFTEVHLWLRYEIVERMQAGEPTILVALQSHIERDEQLDESGDALVYLNRTWHRLREHSVLAN